MTDIMRDHSGYYLAISYSNVSTLFMAFTGDKVDSFTFYFTA